MVAVTQKQITFMLGKCLPGHFVLRASILFRKSFYLWGNSVVGVYRR